MKPLQPYLFFWLLACAALAGCNNDRLGVEPDEGGLYLRVEIAPTSINTDNTLWEDRVDDLRMIAFDAADGTVVFNQKLFFPDGFENPSRAVPLEPGTYDFYFLANETAATADFVTALETLSNRSQFSTDARFHNLPYDPDFAPDAATAAGRFVMSAVYTGITVSAGGTFANPLPLPLPTPRVELIRALAKVDVVLRKRTPGSTIEPGKITSLRMAGIAATVSVPPLDAFYTGTTTVSNPADLSGLDYASDSLGRVTFYIPELLLPQNPATSTRLVINNRSYPIETDAALVGLASQRRTVEGASSASVVRNYHYIVNAYLLPDEDSDVQIQVHVTPWNKDTYLILFDDDNHIVIPPVIPTDSSIIIPTDCGKVEILSANEFLSQGLQGAYNDQIVYYDPETQGPLIRRGDPPYYCEKKYGPGWRLINSCELLSFLAYFDKAYNVWTSNTWEAAAYDLPYYSRTFRQAAQLLLESLTGFDLSSSVLQDENNFEDQLTDFKLGLIDDELTPGDILVREQDYPGGWPYPTPPGTSESETWIYNEVSIDVIPYWYPGYISYSQRDNWNTILYQKFRRYDYSSTVSRCVREID